MEQSNTAAYADVSIVAKYRGASTSDVIEEPCYDISKGGMFVRSFKPLPSGTLIKFECSVANSSKDIQGIGRVVWHRDEDCPEAPSGMGVKFLVLRPGSPEVIDAVLRKAGPMPKLFGSTQIAGKSADERSRQQTSFRASTLVGDEAKKLAREIKRERIAKREQRISTVRNAANLVAEAKKEPIVKERQPQITPTPIIAIGSVLPVDQDLPRVKESTSKGIRTKGNEHSGGADTARVLKLAARRAQELAEKEATQMNLEVAAESSRGVVRSTSVFSTRTLVFAALSAVILFRIGHAMWWSETEKVTQPQTSTEQTATSGAAPESLRGETPRDLSVHSAGPERPTLGSVQASSHSVSEPTHPPVRSAVTSAALGTFKEKDTSEPGPAPTAGNEVKEDRSESRNSRFERALECRNKGDNACVLRLLSGNADSEQERRLLAETYRSMGRNSRARQDEEKYERRRSAAKPRTAPAQKSDFKRSTGGIPDNPYPE
ncbi:MAG: PilZ domain-containing protein [Deltaproteobacteria bacterium]|nr:PilZ domain-containing protein [Deltaproteobacteria bacterium]